MNLYQPTITGSLSVSGSINISGSINVVGGGGTITGTASYATNADLLDGLDSTAFTLTSSFAAFTSSQNILNGTYATTGSNTFKNPQTINSNLTVTGSITAQTLIVSTINATQSYSSGSNIFGNNISNTQVFTGSVYITGSVGIGTNSPSVPLEVYLAGGGPTVRITNSGTGVGTGNGFHIGSDIGSPYNATFVQNEIASIAFYTNDGSSVAERMRINSSGSVGIGTPSFYNSKLNIQKSSSEAQPNEQIRMQSTGGSVPSTWRFDVDAANGGFAITDNSAGERLRISTKGAVTLTASDDGIGQYFWFTGNAAVSSNFSLYAYSNNVYFNAYQTMVIRANQGTTGGSIQLSGGVVYVGGASITNSGSTMNVIGTSTSLPLSRFFVNAAGSQSQPCIRFDKYDNTNTTSQVFIDFTINNQNSGCGSITANGASQATFTTWSDIRLKENITNLPSQLSNIMALRPVEFDYKNGSGHQIGFIAQEVQEIYPDIVGENAEGYLTISGLSKMESRLIKAIQELQAQINELKNK